MPTMPLRLFRSGSKIHGSPETRTYPHSRGRRCWRPSLRALLQRNKGRDLFDLAHALDVFEGFEHRDVVRFFGQYLQRSGLRISRAEAEQRMFAKLNNPGFITDLRPLLAASDAPRLNDETLKTAFTKIFSRFIVLIPGGPWQRSDEMKERFGVAV